MDPAAFAYVFGSSKLFLRVVGPDLGPRNHGYRFTRNGFVCRSSPIVVSGP